MKNISRKRMFSFVLLCAMSIAWMGVIYQFSGQGVAETSVLSMNLADLFVQGPDFDTEVDSAKQKEETEKKDVEVTDAEEADADVAEVKTEDVTPHADVQNGDTKKTDAVSVLAVQTEETDNVKVLEEKEKVDTAILPEQTENDGGNVGENKTKKITLDNYKPIREEHFESTEQYDIFTATNYAIRKMGHVLIYMVLAALVYLTAGVLKLLPSKLYTPALISAPLCILFAISDEIHQLFIDGRSGRVSDVVIDTIGIVIGTMISLAVVCMYNSYINRRRIEVEKE